jgi:hypothetical protein
MRRLLFTGAIVLVTGMLLGVALPMRPQAQTAASIDIDQPLDWVPFSADVKITLFDGTLEKGRFFRDRLGSQKWDISTAADGRRLITISNVDRSLYYRSTDGTNWTSQPIELNRFNHQPVRISNQMKEFTPFSYRLDLQAGGSGTVRAQTGLRAYRQTTPQGDTFLRVPALNFFPVVQNSLAHFTRVYTNITLADPPAKEFEPPAGALVAFSSRPKQFGPNADAARVAQ